MMTLTIKSEDTPLQVKLNDFAEQIAKLGEAAALLMLIVLLIKYFISFRINSVPSASEAINNLVKFKDLMEDITLLCIVDIEDSLREGIQQAVADCKDAGVKVQGIVMEGPEIRNLSPERMNMILPRLQILAKSSPEDKKILVGRLKDEFNDIVAETGDGTNDGPALRTADVGFSMGISSTELWVNLIMDTFAALALATALLFADDLGCYGVDTVKSDTIVFNTFVSLQIFNEINLMVSAVGVPLSSIHYKNQIDSEVTVRSLPGPIPVPRQEIDEYNHS
ncbi:11682_t:CDS:2 [Racocetra fulgida]|uniref:11682_t:CDS:1 n=1 Tax=Racocetra fulgida TaxID=60492 RepID=A0A9N9A4S3_9GLOM|nr:11682_t:CDS:2 [Racocetra fulgida]